MPLRMSAFDQLYEGDASAEVDSARRAAQRRRAGALRRALRRCSAAARRQRAPPSSDIAATLRDYAEGINASPERLAEIEDRLALLDRLKRKYGKTVAEVIAFGEDVARKLSEVEDRDEILKTLRADLEKSAAAYKKVAPPRSPPSASTAAAKLAKLAEAQINSLAMKVRFEVSMVVKALVLTMSHIQAGHQPLRKPAQNAHWTSAGWDEVEFRIATNRRRAAEAADRNRLRRRALPRSAGAESSR